MEPACRVEVRALFGRREGFGGGHFGGALFATCLWRVLVFEGLEWLERALNLEPNKAVLVLAEGSPYWGGHLSRFHVNVQVTWEDGKTELSAGWDG